MNNEPEQVNIDEPVEKAQAKKKRGEHKPIYYPIIAVVMDVVCAACVGLAIASLFSGMDGLSFVLFLLFALGALITPVLAIAYGIYGLCIHKQVGKLGIALSVIAIALPVITVIVIISLALGGVPLIRFM